MSERTWNRHHVLWERDWYRGKEARRLREHKGLIVPMDVGIHRELHAEIAPPPKMSGKLIVQSLFYLDTLSDVVLNDPLRTVGELADFMYNRADRLGERVGQHLMRQLVYLQDGICDRAA